MFFLDAIVKDQAEPSNQNQEWCNTVINTAEKEHVCHSVCVPCCIWEDFKLPVEEESPELANVTSYLMEHDIHANAEENKVNTEFDREFIETQIGQVDVNFLNFCTTFDLLETNTLNGCIENCSVAVNISS